jgi:hypothetical protein
VTFSQKDAVLLGVVGRRRSMLERNSYANRGYLGFGLDWSNRSNLR